MLAGLFFGFVLGFVCFWFFFCNFFCLFAFSLVFCFVLFCGGGCFVFLEEDLHSIRNISTFLKIGKDAVEALNRNTKFFWHLIKSYFL